MFHGFFSKCSFTSTLLELNKLAFEIMLQELQVKVFSYKKNMPTHSFLSDLRVFLCCFSPLGE